jgi:hypothetical protein
MSVLFYSKSCPNCLEFLTKLREENMFGLFDELFCVDGRQQLPEFLHAIPTIIVPDSDKPLVGDDAFSWLTFKLNQKYKINELGTIQTPSNFVDLTKDPNDLVLDSENYISIDNIDKPLKPLQQSTERLFQNAESMDVAQRLEMLQQERANFMSSQQGPPPPKPNFKR